MLCYSVISYTWDLQLTTKLGKPAVNLQPASSPLSSTPSQHSTYLQRVIILALRYKFLLCRESRTQIYTTQNNRFTCIYTTEKQKLLQLTTGINFREMQKMLNDLYPTHSMQAHQFSIATWKVCKRCSSISMNTLIMSYTGWVPQNCWRSQIFHRL